MGDVDYPRAPRLLTVLGVGLISALLVAGVVFGGMLVLHPAEPGEDWAGLFAFLLAPPAQLIVGTWIAWHVLRTPTPRPLRTWAISTGGALALVAVVMLPLGLAGCPGAWRTLGLAFLGTFVGGVVPAAASRSRCADSTT